MLINQSIARIRAFRAAKGWSIGKMASAAGIGESAIRKMDADDWNPESKTLKKLETIIPAEFDPSKPDGGLGDQQSKPGEAA